MEEKINWYEEKPERSNTKDFERFAIARYKDKLMSVVVDFKKNGLEARLKAMITSPKRHGNRDIEYFYQRCFVGSGKEFYNKMLEHMKYKQDELEIIAKEED